MEMRVLIGLRCGLCEVVKTFLSNPERCGLMRSGVLDANASALDRALASSWVVACGRAIETIKKI